MDRPERLVHHSGQPIRPIESRTQVAGQRFKPQGFWISVEGDDDWRSWCVSESFGLSQLTHVYDVALSEGARILRLSGADDIDAFTAEYAADRRGSDVDWPRVAEKHQGIIIAPYCWWRRLGNHTLWYYSWDCASGCIWDASAIASVTLREIVPEPAPRSF